MDVCMAVMYCGGEKRQMAYTVAPLHPSAVHARLAFNSTSTHYTVELLYKDFHLSQMPPFVYSTTTGSRTPHYSGHIHLAQANTII